MAPSPVHPGTYKLVVLHRGTVTCVKVVVPQTGKAVEGVCPRLVQGCAVIFMTLKVKKISSVINFFLTNISMDKSAVLSCYILCKPV